MKWFKHMTNSQDDPSLAALVAELGWEGYGWYWVITEKIAASICTGNECSLEFSTDKWKHTLGISSKRFHYFMEISEKFNVFVVEFSQKNQEFCKISSPNLLNLKDEYSKRSGQTPKQEVEVEEEGDREEEKEEERKKTIHPPLHENKPPKSPKKRVAKAVEPEELENSEEPVVLPDWLPRDTWESLKKYRESIKKPMKDSTERFTLKRLTKAKENGWNPVELIEDSIANRWTGVVFDKHLNSINTYNKTGYPYESHERRGSSQSAIQLIEQWKRSTDPIFTNGKTEPETVIAGEFVRLE